MSLFTTIDLGRFAPRGYKFRWCQTYDLHEHVANNSDEWFVLDDGTIIGRHGQPIRRRLSLRVRGPLDNGPTYNSEPFTGDARVSCETHDGQWIDVDIAIINSRVISCVDPESHEHRLRRVFLDS